MQAGFGDPLEAPPTDDFSGDTEAADMATLVRVLVEDMESRPSIMEPDTAWVAPRKKEFAFDEVADAAVANDCFSWMIEGKEKKGDGDESRLELSRKSMSSLGKLFTAKYGGRKFRLKDGRLVRFGQRGRNRHKRYTIEIVEGKR